VTTNAARAATLVRALRARIDGDRGAVADLYTDDVKAWAPRLSTSSRHELLAEFDRRDEAFTDAAIQVLPLDVGSDYACAEWTVTMTHTGRLDLGDGRSIEPTGDQVVIHGVTVAEFRDERICAFRQYWDEATLADQLGLFGGRAG
jgi:ketosteroid isomerase-like protein